MAMAMAMVPQLVDKAQARVKEQADPLTGRVGRAPAAARGPAER
jgi:hypothetical protein